MSVISSPLSPSPSGEGERLTERPPRSMKHPEGRITAQRRSDRLLGCSSGRTTPINAGARPEPAQNARSRPKATQHWRSGGLTNHFSPKPFACDSGGCFEQTKTTYVTGQAKDSRRLDFGMRARAANPLLAVTICCACRGPLPTSGGGAGAPAAIAQVRLFDEERGTDLTLHTGLPDDQSIRLQVRLYAPDGHRLTEIVGGVQLTLQFSPDSLANAIPVPGRPLETIITPPAPAGTNGSQTVRLDFPGTGTAKSFGPFHLEVQPGISGRTEFRLFDASNADFTAHVPLVSGDTTRLEVRLYDSTGARRTAIPGGARVTFRFDPDSLAVAAPIAGLPFWKAVVPTSSVGTEGSLFVSVLFLADSTTKTYGPIQVLVH